MSAYEEYLRLTKQADENQDSMTPLLMGAGLGGLAYHLYKGKGAVPEVAQAMTHAAEEARPGFFRRAGRYVKDVADGGVRTFVNRGATVAAERAVDKTISGAEGAVDATWQKAKDLYHEHFGAGQAGAQAAGQAGAQAAGQAGAAHSAVPKGFTHKLDYRQSKMTGTRFGVKKDPAAAPQPTPSAQTSSPTPGGVPDPSELRSKDPIPAPRTQRKPLVNRGAASGFSSPQTPEYEGKGWTMNRKPGQGPAHAPSGASPVPPPASGAAHQAPTPKPAPTHGVWSQMGHDGEPIIIGGASNRAPSKDMTFHDTSHKAPPTPQQPSPAPSTPKADKLMARDMKQRENIQKLRMGRGPRKFSSVQDMVEAFLEKAASFVGSQIGRPVSVLESVRTPEIIKLASDLLSLERDSIMEAYWSAPVYEKHAARNWMEENISMVNFAQAMLGHMYKSAMDESNAVYQAEYQQNAQFSPLENHQGEQMLERSYLTQGNDYAPQHSGIPVPHAMAAGAAAGMLGGAFLQEALSGGAPGKRPAALIGGVLGAEAGRRFLT